MNSPSLADVFLQLVYYIPLLLVLLVGGVMALMNLGKATGASILTILGILTILFETISSHFLRHLVISSQNLTSEEVSRYMTVIGVLGGIVFSLGLGLIFVAVFWGRSPRHEKAHSRDFSSSGSGEG